MAEFITFSSMTLDEYNNLDDVIENRLYFITDTQEIKLNGATYSPNPDPYVKKVNYNDTINRLNDLIDTLQTDLVEIENNINGGDD